MKPILSLIALIIGSLTYAQERIDTLYYNRSGQIAQNILFQITIELPFIRQIRLAIKNSKTSTIRENYAKRDVFAPSTASMITKPYSTEKSEPISEMAISLRNHIMQTDGYTANIQVSTSMERLKYTPLTKRANYPEHTKPTTKTAPTESSNTTQTNRSMTIIYCPTTMVIH